MDLMRARVALRERPLLDIFDLAVRFCAAHAWAYAKLSLFVLVPAFAVSWGAARLGSRARRSWPSRRASYSPRQWGPVRRSGSR
jgi:hypothetical protein